MTSSFQLFLEQILGFGVAEKLHLYETAFTHKSFSSHAESYETLEFLGDSVLSLVVVKFLFENYANRKCQEGMLTKMKTKIICGETLGGIGVKLGLHNYIKMSSYAIENGYNFNPKIIEDVFEALCGAIYLHRGLPVARDWILSIITNNELLNWTESVIHDKNYKDLLMRTVQKKYNGNLPEYQQLSHTPSTPRQFRIAAVVEGKQLGVGRGPSKKIAEQEAAYFAIRRMEKMYGETFIKHKGNYHNLNINS